MPTIPIYSASEQTGRVPNAAVSTSVKGTGTATIGQAIGHFATAFGNLAEVNNAIDAKLQAVSDDLAAKTSKGDYDAGIKSIENDLSRNPDIIAQPNKYFDEFQKRETDLQAKLTGRLSGGAQLLFQEHLNVRAPMAYAEARAAGRKIWDHSLKAQWLESRETSLQTASNPEIPEDARKEALNSWIDSTKNLAGVGVLFADEAQKDITKAKEEVSKRFVINSAAIAPDDFLEALGRGDFKEVDADTQTKAITKAQAIITKRDHKAHQVSLEIKDGIRSSLVGASNFGELGSFLVSHGTSLDELAAGTSWLSGYIDAKDARPIIEHNNNPISGEGTLAVRSLVSRFDGGTDDPYAKPRLKEFKQYANSLEEQIGLNKELLAFKKRLNDIGEQQDREERSNKLLSLAIAGSARATLSDRQRAARDAFDGIVKRNKMMEGFIGNQTQMYHGRINDFVRKGIPEDEAVEQVLKDVGFDKSGNRIVAPKSSGTAAPRQSSPTVIPRPGPNPDIQNLLR